MTTYQPQHHRRTFLATTVLLAGAVLCAVAAVMTYILAVQTYTGQALENQGLSNSTESIPHPAALSLLRLVGSPPLILGSLALVVLIGVLTRNPATGRRRVRYGVAGGLTAAVSIATTEFLKYSLPRPQLDLARDGSPVHNSFPSGHTTVAAAIGLGLLLAVPPLWRGLLAAPVLLATGLVAAATLVTGWHRVSDTIGATLIAGTYFFLAAALTGLPEAKTIPTTAVPHLPTAPATAGRPHPHVHHHPSPAWSRPLASTTSRR